MSIDLIKARIKSVMSNLPPLPQVTRQLLLIIADEKASAQDVAKVLSSDQALAGKVLKLVNSSFYGVQQDVTTISRAVVLLGFTGVRNLAMGFGSISALQKLGGELDMEGFWAHALANGAAAQSLAPFVNRRTDPEEAFLAGLMHDIGAYVLAVAVPEIYAPILEDPGRDRLEAESEMCGMTHAQVGRGLLKFWGLPHPFSDAAGYHHDFARATDGSQPLTNLVALADVLACVHGGTFETAASEKDLEGLLAAAGLTMDHIRSALVNMDEKIGDMASFLHIAGAKTGSALKLDDQQPLTGVVVTTDDNRREWVATLLKYMGHSTFPMEGLFNSSPGSENVDLVLVDPQCMTTTKFEQLMTFLSSLDAGICVLAEPGAVLPRGAADLPSIPMVFSRLNLQTALSGLPA